MSRTIPMTVHGALEMGLGFALLAAPFALEMSAAGFVTSFTVGVILMGLAIGASGGSGRGTIPVRAHAAYDGGMALGLVAAGLALGIAGDTTALAVLAAAGVLQAALSATTRYIATPAGA